MSEDLGLLGKDNEAFELVHMSLFILTGSKHLSVPFSVSLPMCSLMTGIMAAVCLCRNLLISWIMAQL